MFGSLVKMIEYTFVIQYYYSITSIISTIYCLQPSNIFKGFDQNWKIGDFGLAAEMCIQNKDKTLFAKQNALHTKGAGTSLYMAPEQKTTQNYTKKVDIFSLGLIFYELLSIFKNSKIRENTFKLLRKGKFSETFQNDFPTEVSLSNYLNLGVYYIHCFFCSLFDF